ncbi:MAG TPA: hypothetical protein VLB79_01055 [Solirubrobacterales bacterium]|nr:hypothetical protein [Solirubrobacterales bacterium]
MTTTSAEECLEQLLPQPASASAISSLVSGIDHVGFMAAPEDEGALNSAAAEAGFGSDGHTFPSTILTRQLAELAGRAVPTTIFEALAADPDRGSLRVEVAIPRGIERNALDDWIRQGIGAHLAFGVSSPARFGVLGELVEAQGFRSPGSLQGRPCTNPASGVTSLFFDRRPEEPLGLEFCHYA